MLSFFSYQHSSVVTSVVFVCTIAIYHHLANSIPIRGGLTPYSWFSGRHMSQAQSVRLRPEIFLEIIGNEKHSLDRGAFHWRRLASTEESKSRDTERKTVLMTIVGFLDPAMPEDIESLDFSVARASKLSPSFIYLSFGSEWAV